MVQLTREEKESGIITTAIFAVVLILLFVLKFDVEKEEDDKEDGGDKTQGPQDDEVVQSAFGVKTEFRKQSSELR